MRWGRFVLIFQAIITLIIGMVFFMQVVNLDAKDIGELKVEVIRDGLFKVNSDEKVFIDIKKRYSTAAYILLVIGVIEVLILSRLWIGK